MLSLSPRAMYSFEPLRMIRVGASNLENWGTEDLDAILPTMEGIFDCDPAYVDLGRWRTDEEREATLTKGGTNIAECLDASPLVVKTIRLRVDKFAEWKAHDRDNLDWLKVVHLVRDPRARYHSLLEELRSFKTVIDIFGDSCQWEIEDLAIKNLVPPQK